MIRRAHNALPLLIAIAALIGAGLVAYAQSTSDYKYQTVITVTNNTGSALSNQAVRVPLNASQYVDNGYLASDGQDILAIGPGGAEVKITAQFDGDLSSWWLPITSLGAGSTNQTSIYTGESTTAADNPQSIWLQGSSESIDVTDAASLDITTDLTLDSQGTVLATWPSSDGYLIDKPAAYRLGVRQTGGNNEVFARIVGSTVSTDDSSSNSNTLTENGNPVLAGGALNEAADLDGTGDYYDAGSHVSIDDIFSGGGTLEVYVNFDTFVDDDAIMHKGSTFQDQWTLRQDTSFNGCSSGTAAFFFAHGFSTTAGLWYTDECVLTTDAGWQRIGITYNNASTSNDPVFYVNGASVALTESSTPSGTANSDASDNLLIGNTATTNSEADAQFDDVRAWDDIRTSTEISSNYNTELTGSESNLQGYWKLNAGTVVEASTQDADADTGGTQAFVTGTAYDVVATFDGANLVLNIDGGSDEATAASSLTLNANSYAVRITGITGHVARTRIGSSSVASPTYVLDLQYEPPHMAQTSGSSPDWSGTIADQSTSNNDATYTFWRDTSNISVSVGALQVTEAEAAAGSETFATAVSGTHTDPVANPYAVGSGFAFPLSLITDHGGSNVPDMFFAMLFILLGGVILGGLALVSPIRALGIVAIAASVGMAIGVYMTPAENIFIVLAAFPTIAVIALVRDPWERI